MELLGYNLRRFGRRGRFRGPLCVSESISFHGRDEAVATARESLDVPRLFGGVAESLADAVHCGIQPMLKITEGLGRPQLVLQFFSGDQFARPAQQGGQHLVGLSGQTYAYAVPSQFLTSQVYLERTKAKNFCGLSPTTHGSPQSGSRRVYAEISNEIPQL
jgi:hypothetical protein